MVTALLSGYIDAAAHKYCAIGAVMWLGSVGPVRNAPIIALSGHAAFGPAGDPPASTDVFG